MHAHRERIYYKPHTCTQIIQVSYMYTERATNITKLPVESKLHQTSTKTSCVHSQHNTSNREQIIPYNKHDMHTIINYYI